MAKQQWSELSPGVRKALIAAGVIEVALTAFVHRDLSKRSAADVRGPRLMWRLATFVQPIGPIAYLLAGRST